MKNPDFIVVDGSGFMFRAYYALPPLTGPKGQPTGAILGMVNMLKKVISDYQPTNMVVVFDGKAKTFRHEMYAEYKANRGSMPEDLAKQILPMQEIIRAMGLHLIIADGVEADDIIASIIKKAEELKWSSLIASSDKDLFQLVTENTHQLDTLKNKIYDSAAVKEKFGINVSQIADYLALIGDASDNIPGIAKVGPKTAVKWLDKYKNLAGVIAHRDEIKGVVGDNLRNNLDILELSRNLVALNTECDFFASMDDFSLTLSSLASINNELQVYGIKPWSQSLVTSTEIKENKNTSQEDSTKVINVETGQALKKYLETTDDVNILSIFIDTYNSNPEIFNVAIAENESVVLPLNSEMINVLLHWAENRRLQIVSFNIKNFLKVLHNLGVKFTLTEKIVDLMLLGYLDNTSFNNTEPLRLFSRYLGATVDFEINTYAAHFISVAQDVLPKIFDYDINKKLYSELDLPFSDLLFHMETYGVRIDCAQLKSQSEDLQHELDNLSEQAYAISGAPFNLNSPKQLQEILYKQLELPVLEKTPKGQASTAESVLVKLAEDYELPAIILRYRSLAKLKSTYTDSLPNQVNANTNRIHTLYHQTVTTTGRLSSSDPNLQNIPIKTAEGRRVRQAFVADEGYKIVSADYSQVELRIMAHLSQDPALLEAFANNIDIHRVTAAKIYNIELDDVTSEHRNKAKAVNFGLIYGMSAFGLSKQLQLERKEAQRLIDEYFANFSQVEKFMHETRIEAKQNGFVQTILGRRIYIPEIQSKNKMRQKAAERAAINAPMQGSNAEIIKLAMLEIQKWIETEKLDIKMIMQVHDELVFEVSESILELGINKIKSIMENAQQLAVPLTVSVGAGKSWEQAH